MRAWNRTAVVTTIALGVLGSCTRPEDSRTRTSVQITGTVLEQMDGPPYTYLRIKTEAGEAWAMVPVTKVRQNERVTITEGVLLKDFDTGVPGRRFDVIMGALER